MLELLPTNWYGWCVLFAALLQTPAAVFYITVTRMDVFTPGSYRGSSDPGPGFFLGLVATLGSIIWPVSIPGIAAWMLGSATRYWLDKREARLRDKKKREAEIQRRVDEIVEKELIEYDIKRDHNTKDIRAISGVHA